MRPWSSSTAGWFTGACWEPVLPHLSAPCPTPGLPGRAGRPAGLTALTIGDLARAVADDIDAAGFDQDVLVGHSLAGVVIPQVASLLPHRIRRLVFLSATVPRGPPHLPPQPPDLTEGARA